MFEGIPSEATNHHLAPTPGLLELLLIVEQLVDLEAVTGSLHQLAQSLSDIRLALFPPPRLPQIVVHPLKDILSEPLGHCPGEHEQTENREIVQFSSASVSFSGQKAF